MDDNFYNHLKTLFIISKKKEKPKNLKELNEHYIQFIKHITSGNLCSRGANNGSRTTAPGQIRQSITHWNDDHHWSDPSVRSVQQDSN